MKKIALSKHFAKLAAALFAVAALTCATSALHAQTSFGKLRGNAEKALDVELEDEETVEAINANDASDEGNDAKTQSDAKPKKNNGARSSKTRRTNKPGVSRTAGNKERAQETNALDNAEPDEESATDDEKAEKPKEKLSPSDIRKRKNAQKNDKEKESANNGRGPILGKPESHKYRAGMIFAAPSNGSCNNIVGTAPVPTEFYEQKVRTLEEDFPRVAKVDYRDVKEGGAKQLVFKMRELKPGQQVEATALFEVTRYPMLPPAEPQIYSIPKNPPKELRRYLKDGPYIESNAKGIRTLAKETIKDVEGDWEKVAAILDYVRTNIQYKEVLIEKPIRGAIAAIKSGDGDCEDMSALFIALCRAAEIPARLVRVPGHCWAEFYLEDDAGEGYWFPAQVAGTEPLGSLQDCRVILQKGDNFKLPESPKEETLYVKELFMGNVKEGADDPFHQFIQEVDGE